MAEDLGSCNQRGSHSFFTAMIDPVPCDVIYKAIFGVLIPGMRHRLLIVYTFGAIETPIRRAT